MLLRIKYRKTPEGRFLSHLDLVRTMQRAFRRARLPLAYSEGFNPHPKLSYGSALAVGVASDGEYLDLELRKGVELDGLKGKLQEAMPPGLEIMEIKELSQRKESLSALINMARYRVEVPLSRSVPQESIERAIAGVLARNRIEATREGKKGARSVDIRKGIYELTGRKTETGLDLIMDLQTGSEGNVRPEEVVRAVVDALVQEAAIEDQGEMNCHIRRLGLFIRHEGRIINPMEA